MSTLYVIATPIGNLEDMTPRAVRTLREADVIAAEDTRHSRGLLNHFEIKTPMFSCHKFNEGKRGDFFVNAMLEGKSVALISDAGTPCISDPGHRLVKMAADAGIPVVPICGASAVVSALSICGEDVSKFTFLGFLPRGKEVLVFLTKVLHPAETVVFYESPKRIKATLKILSENFPTARVCLCNDISKKFERVYRGTADEVLQEICENPSAEKGEYTCVVNLPPAPEDENPAEPEDAFTLEAQLVDIMVKSNCNPKDASQKLHEKNPKLSKKEIYAAMLKLKTKFSLLEK